MSVHTIPEQRASAPVRQVAGLLDVGDKSAFIRAATWRGRATYA
ncbi:hypothetical protein ACFQ0B_09400 [Nonomuraea thailandensis]